MQSVYSILSTVNGLVLENETIAHRHLPPSQVRATVDNLVPDKLYRVYVAAKTMQGLGEKYPIDLKTARDDASMLFFLYLYFYASFFHAIICFYVF